jgi:hypothetical protein
MRYNARRYSLLPFQCGFVSGYPQCKQWSQHVQPINPAIAYDWLLVNGM